MNLSCVFSLYEEAVSRLARIRNGCIRENVGEASIMEKVIEYCLKWFGHVWRRPIEPNE